MVGKIPAPRLGAVRIYWIIAILLISVFWVFSDLTLWHFIFFCFLSAGLYASYSRINLPLAVYLSMTLLFWIIVPFFQVVVGVGFYVSSEAVPDFGPEALAFIAVNYFGIYLGFQVKRFRFFRNAEASTKFSLVGVLFALSVLVAMILFVGIETVTLSRVEQMEFVREGHIAMLRNITKVVPAILLAYFVLESRKGLSPAARFAVFAVLASCFIVVSNPINTGRFLSLLGAFIIFVSYAIKFSRVRLLLWFLAGAPFYSIILLGITSSMRHGLDGISFVSAIDSIQSLEFSSYAVFIDALSMDYFQNSNYLISHLLIVIPRGLWLGKAESIGIDVAMASGYVYDNVGLVSFFNAYADYGYFGLFSISVMFGILSKNLNPVFAQPSFRNRRFMYGVLFTASMPMLFRGDLSSMVLAFYPTIVAYEFIRFVTRFRLVQGPR